MTKVFKSYSEFLSLEDKTTMANNMKLDFQTLPEIADYMASLIHPGAITIFEPTPGIGNLVNAMHGRGYDITAPEDYFLQPMQRYDCVVMNPPFSNTSAILTNAPTLFKPGMKIGYIILDECMQMSDHVIALMPWFTLINSDVRLRSIKNYGIKSITSLPRRAFRYARIQTVVMDLVKGWSHPTEFLVYDL